MHSALGLVGGALDRLVGVAPGLLALALVLHVGKVAAEARAWHTILRHAYPHSDVRFKATLAAFAGAIGANALLPARIGEGVRLGIVRRRVPGSNVTTTASTILLETTVELVFGALVVGAMLLAGRSLGPLGTPAAAVQFLAAHPLALAAVATAVAGLGLLAYARRARVRQLAGRFVEGAAILRHPRDFVCGVVAWKLVAWALRFAAVYFFLVAFHLGAALWVVVLVVAAQNAAALVPLSPGNAGTQQAAFAVVLAGTASASAVLGFGVGMQAATAITDLCFGAAAVSFIATRDDVRRVLRLGRWRPHVLAPPA